MKIVISSGHGLHIRGASGPEPWGLDEVNEARRVVDKVADYLRLLDVDVTVFHDDVSTGQQENLERITDFHNAQGPHDLDISVHFNAYEVTENPRGTEVWYATEGILAEDLAAVISDATGLLNRGPKISDSLFFLNQTSEKACLLEICFVDSEADATLYRQGFNKLCKAIAETLAGPDEDEDEDENEDEMPTVRVSFKGTCSWFGGPDDTGVGPEENLAFIYDKEMAPGLFLPEQPPGTTGLARALNPDVFYVACRWDYSVTPKSMLQDQSLMAVVWAPKTGRTFLAHPADWGPHEEKTGRAADLSPGLLEALGIETDDEVQVMYPVPADDEVA